MHHQRIAAFLLGAWIMGSLFMIFVATQNFELADTLGPAGSRALLRAMAGGLNQIFFLDWERVELGIGIALTGWLWFGMRKRLLAGLSAASFILVAAQHFFVTPQMLALARHLDNASAASQFGTLHAVYGITDVVKLVICVVLAALLLPAWSDRNAVVQVQPVDYAHHGHVDR
jgi:hypothetical protein